METNNKENWDWKKEFDDVLKKLDNSVEYFPPYITHKKAQMLFEELLSSSKAKWKEELVGKIEEIKPSYITGDCTKEGAKQKNIYRQALQDCIEIIKEL